MLVALAEMLIAGSTPERPIGFRFDPGHDFHQSVVSLFSEGPSCYLVEVDPSGHDPLGELLAVLGEDIEWAVLGTLTDQAMLESCDHASVPVEDLAAAWLGTLDW
jgi:hypothetical protein